MQESTLGPSLFLLYINDLPKIIYNKPLNILFADDDNSTLVSNSNSTDFRNDMNIVFERINEWFKAKLLRIIFNETHFIQFTAKSKYIWDINITYDNK
jgi:hypothetical protein